MSLKTASVKAGNGVLTALGVVAVIAHDGPRKERIAKIDLTIAELQEERAQLVEELIDSTDI